MVSFFLNKYSTAELKGQMCYCSKSNILKAAAYQTQKYLIERFFARRYYSSFLEEKKKTNQKTLYG